MCKYQTPPLNIQNATINYILNAFGLNRKYTYYIYISIVLGP